MEGIPGQARGSKWATATSTRGGGKARSPSREKAEGDTQLTFPKSWKQHLRILLLHNPALLKHTVKWRGRDICNIPNPSHVGAGEAGGERLSKSALARTHSKQC